MDGDPVDPPRQPCEAHSQQCQHNTAGVAATKLPPSSLTLAQIRRTVRDLDPQLEADDDVYKAAVCLLSTLTIGAHARRVAKFTGYPYRFVAPLAWHWRANRVWVRRRRLPAKICHSGWGDPEHGCVAFWLDVMVGMGLVTRQCPATAEPAEPAEKKKSPQNSKAAFY